MGQTYDPELNLISFIVCNNPSSGAIVPIPVQSFEDLQSVTPFISPL
jgi:hypothetical protein